MFNMKEQFPAEQLDRNCTIKTQKDSRKTDYHSYSYALASLMLKIKSTFLHLCCLGPSLEKCAGHSNELRENI